MLALRIVIALIALPATLTVAVVRALVWVIRWPRRVRLRAAATLICPSGHPNPVMGRWTCGCGAAYLGHAFANCPICGMPAGWLRCATCGLAIPSPWKDEP